MSIGPGMSSEDAIREAESIVAGMSRTENRDPQEERVFDVDVSPNIVLEPNAEQTKAYLDRFFYLYHRDQRRYLSFGKSQKLVERLRGKIEPGKIVADEMSARMDGAVEGQLHVLRVFLEKIGQKPVMDYIVNGKWASPVGPRVEDPPSTTEMVTPEAVTTALSVGEAKDLLDEYGYQFRLVAMINKNVSGANRSSEEQSGGWLKRVQSMVRLPEAQTPINSMIGLCEGRLMMLGEILDLVGQAGPRSQIETNAIEEIRTNPAGVKAALAAKGELRSKKVLEEMARATRDMMNDNSGD